MAQQVRAQTDLAENPDYVATVYRDSLGLPELKGAIAIRPTCVVLPACTLLPPPRALNFLHPPSSPALKIHLSSETKAVLEEFDGFELELRGDVEMKVEKESP